MHPKGAGSQEPLPILDGVLIVRRKEAKPALAIGFGVGGMVGARGEIYREQRADPVIEKKDAAWCQHASDLYQDCERVVEDAEPRSYSPGAPCWPRRGGAGRWGRSFHRDGMHH